MNAITLDNQFRSQRSILKNLNVDSTVIRNFEQSFYDYLVKRDYINSNKILNEIKTLISQRKEKVVKVENVNGNQKSLLVKAIDLIAHAAVNIVLYLTISFVIICFVAACYLVITTGDKGLLIGMTFTFFFSSFYFLFKKFTGGKE